MSEPYKIAFEVLAEPVPLARVRFSRGRAYQPARNRDYRQAVQAAAAMAMTEFELMTGAVAVTLKLFRRFKPTARNFGDCDNHAKAVLDALNGVVFADDAQVVTLAVEKHTDKVKPRAEIEVCTIAPQDFFSSKAQKKDGS